MKNDVGAADNSTRNRDASGENTENSQAMHQFCRLSSAATSDQSGIDFRSNNAIHFNWSSSLQAEQNRPYSVPAGHNCLPNTHSHSDVLLLSNLLILAIPLCLNCRIWRCRLLCSLRLLLHSIDRILIGHNLRGLIIRISIRHRRVFVLICWHSIHLLSWLYAQTNTPFI
jgi:hypothetical protein